MHKITIQIAICLAIATAGCASKPSQAEMELDAYNKVLAEKVSKKQMTETEAEFARQQYIGTLRARESNIAASNGIAKQANARAFDDAAAGLAMMCSGPGYRNC